MELKPDLLEGPLLDLRKLLKKTAKEATPKRTHDLRTKIRRSETAMRALMLDDTNEGKCLTQAIQPIFKKAGKVRDMDVLTAFATTLNAKGEEDCVAQLLETIVLRRARAARKLERAVKKNGRQVRRRLRDLRAQIEKILKAPGNQFARVERTPAETSPFALEVEEQLSTWPALSAQNVHEFRIKVKELRDLRALAGDEDSEFNRTLGAVKDAIGAWHDWNELAAIADRTLDHGGQCGLKKQIESRTRKHLKHALSEATALQKEFFISVHRS